MWNSGQGLVPPPPPPLQLQAAQVEVLEDLEPYFLTVKHWVVPPAQDASHHQDYEPFLVGNHRESQPKPSFVTVTGRGGQPKLTIFGFTDSWNGSLNTHFYPEVAREKWSNLTRFLFPKMGWNHQVDRWMRCFDQIFHTWFLRGKRKSSPGHDKSWTTWNSDICLPSVWPRHSKPPGECSFNIVVPRWYRNPKDAFGNNCVLSDISVHQKLCPLVSNKRSPGVIPQRIWRKMQRYRCCATLC